MNTHSNASGRLSIANRIAPLLLRLALGATLLSAVADRFGIWGPPGAATVSWGDWTHFVAYTAKVNSFLPSALAPALAIIATAAEALLGITLILGIFRRPVAFASAALFALFAGAMIVSFGVKAPLNYSVFVVSPLHFCWALGQRRQNSNQMMFSSDASSHPQPVKLLPRAFPPLTFAAHLIVDSRTMRVQWTSLWSFGERPLLRRAISMAHA